MLCVWMCVSVCVYVCMCVLCVLVWLCEYVCECVHVCMCVCCVLCVVCVCALCVCMCVCVCANPQKNLTNGLSVYDDASTRACVCLPTSKRESNLNLNPSHNFKQFRRGKKKPDKRRIQWFRLQDNWRFAKFFFWVNILWKTKQNKKTKKVKNEKHFLCEKFFCRRIGHFCR